MSTSTHNPKALVIEKPSKALVDFMNKLRDRKMSQLEKLRNKKKQSDANYQSDKLIILLYENAFFQATREG